MSDDTTTGPWGPWHDHIGEGLAHCADYLGRLQRSHAGEIAPDRHYFGTKARALRDASTGLLRRACDVERWMGACDAGYGSEGGTCALPAGHDGAHGEGPTFAERLAERADALTAVATEVADTLAWATLALDAGDDSPEVTDALEIAARRLGELRRAAGELPTRWPASHPAPDHIGSRAGPARLPVSLILSPPEPPWDTGGRAGDRSHRPRLRPRRPPPA